MTPHDDTVERPRSKQLCGERQQEDESPFVQPICWAGAIAALHCSAIDGEEPPASNAFGSGRTDR